MARLLSIGSTGPDVRALQDVLNFQIRRGEPLMVDGIFGNKTANRVRDFQNANTLKADGIVGPKTEAVLYEVTELPIPLLFMPNLQLTLPTRGSKGIQPPRLIPPLQWPGPPLPPPGGQFTFGPTFSLRQNSVATLPEFLSPNALGLKLKVPTRSDPLDPSVRSRQAIIELINDLPINSKFKAFLTAKVPSTTTSIEPPGTGFQWGVEPLFNPLDPKGFGVGGSAAFAVRVSEGRGGLPNVVVGAWGDGKINLDFESKNGQSRPRVQAEGQIFLGVKGAF